MEVNKLTHEQRNWIINAIRNSFDCIVFQHEQEKIDHMLAKYVDPNTDISAQEVAEDLMYLEKLSN